MAAEKPRRAGERPHDAEKFDHPAHYTAHPSGIECVTVAEGFNFNVGNAVKYLWRAGLKSEDPTEDLRKAAWYVQREIERVAAARAKGPK